MYSAVIVAPCNKIQPVVLYFSTDRTDNYKLVARLLGLTSLLEYEEKLEDEDDVRDGRCELFLLSQELVADKLESTISVIATGSVRTSPSTLPICPYRKFFLTSSISGSLDSCVNYYYHHSFNQNLYLCIPGIHNKIVLMTRLIDFITLLLNCSY